MQHDFKADFPLLRSHDIAYLDNAATAQRPLCVLEAGREFYEEYNANPLRGFYKLASDATEHYEAARETVRRFINAAESAEIIFTRNTSESINLTAYSYGLSFLREGDEILITVAEHHSNMLPWQMVAEKTGARLVYLMCEKDGSYTEEALNKAISPRTKFAAVQHYSNVLGTRSPIEEIIKRVHANGGLVLIDGAQSAPHVKIDVQAMDCDFFAFSGHKLMGPMGIGVLYGKRELLDKMPPFMRGGEMIESVTTEGAKFAPLPHKFEAGTVNAGGAECLAAAIEYIEGIGFETIERLEQELTAYAFGKMSAIPGLHILGSPEPEKHNGVLSFVLDGVHPHDIAEILSADNVCVRAGHHCAQPLLKHLGVYSCTRASLAFYNTQEDIDRLINSLSAVRRKMGIED